MLFATKHFEALKKEGALEARDAEGFGGEFGLRLWAFLGASEGF